MQKIDEIENLIKLISKLPGLGPKSAKRIILKMINNRQELLKPLAQNLSEVFKNIVRLKDSNFPLFDSVYKHMSYNAEYFERFCFYRYFSALKYATENKIDKFLMCDTDAIFLKFLDFIV